MELLVADASFVELLVPAAAVIAGVVLGGLLPDALGRWRDAQAKYDRAISAITRLQSARHGVGVGIPSRFVKARTPEDLAMIEQELSVNGVRGFFEAAATARAALAELYPVSPDLRPYWDKFEVPDAEVDDLVKLLTSRRRRPNKKHAAQPVPELDSGT
jgi:hypothetical protein